jgi:urease accessory protein
MRAAYTEPELPDLAAVTICSPSGGVLRGDHLSIEVQVDAGARLRLETQSATRLYAMPDGSAQARSLYKVGAGAFLEHIPDPLIPYAGASFRQSSIWEVHESATLIVGEVIAAGREARGEKASYRSVETDIEARRPDGQILFTDATRLLPDGASGLGFLGDFVALGSLFVLSEHFTASSFNVALDQHSGSSDLPSQAGAWFKVLAKDSASAAAAVRAAWESARRVLLGRGLPPARRF